MAFSLDEDRQPDPVAFSRLLLHVERGEIPACQADACSQGKRCPCPEACLLPDAAFMKRYRRDRIIVACILVAALLVVVL